MNFVEHNKSVEETACQTAVETGAELKPPMCGTGEMKMVACKDCIHYDMCRSMALVLPGEESMLHICDDFKAKADFAEVKHAAWVYGEYDIPHCSECGSEVMPNNISLFCPNCGAKMDGGDENV